MNSKVKGLLKGLRYISQIFEPNEEEEEEEEEMQIGYPTDVKHVAHIGWDGPSNSTPSWMNEFRNAPLSSLGAEAMGEIGHGDSDKNPPRIVQGCPLQDSRKVIEVESTRSHPPTPEPPQPSKPSRRHASSGGSGTEDGGGDHPSVPPKQSRRNKSSSEAQADSSETEGQSEDPHRRSRRHNRTKERAAAESGSAIPRQTRKKKKPKGSSGEGSARSSSSSTKPRGPDECSDPDLDPEVAPSSLRFRGGMMINQYLSFLFSSSVSLLI